MSCFEYAIVMAVTIETKQANFAIATLEVILSFNVFGIKSILVEPCD